MPARHFLSFLADFRLVFKARIESFPRALTKKGWGADTLYLKLKTTLIYLVVRARLPASGQAAISGRLSDIAGPGLLPGTVTLPVRCSTPQLCSSPLRARSTERTSTTYMSWR